MSESFWEATAKAAEARCENQAKTIGELRRVGNEMARMMRDIAGSNQLDAISRACVIAAAARWEDAKTAQ